MRIWDAENGNLVNEFNPRINKASFYTSARVVKNSSGGESIVILRDDSILIYSNNGVQQNDIELYATRGRNLTIGSIGSLPGLIAVACADGQIRFWTYFNGVKELRALQGHTQSVNALAISPETGWLATGSNDKTGLPGPHAGTKISIEADGLWIGRVPDLNQLVIPDPEISRQHANILVSNDGLQLTDTSANGTFVNGERVTQARLQPGHRIQFGPNSRNTFVIQAVPSAAREAAVPPVRRLNKTMLAPTAVARPANTLIISKHEEDAPRRRLQLILDQYAVSDIPLQANRIEFGRDEAPNRVLIDHASISSRHAEIIVTPGGALLRDLQSKNGTFVNGERITERQLREGDLLQFGACDSRLFLYRESTRRPLALRNIELNRPKITIGRAPGNDVRIDHPTVSSHHARSREDRQWF